MYRAYRACRLALIATLLATVLGYGGGGLVGQPVAAAPEQGVAYGFGDNSEGQLGTGTLGEDRYIPARVSDLTGVKAIASGDRHTLFLLDNGSVYSVGNNETGQLGYDTMSNFNPSPAQITALPANVTAIAAAGYFSMALADGVVYTWGSNDNGELGDGIGANIGTNRTEPAPVVGLPAGVTAIAPGGEPTHVLALIGGVVYTWGNNNYGELGNGTTGTDSPTPTAVPADLPAGITTIASGDFHSLALAGGVAYTWGRNNTGQLGNGTVNPSNPNPAPVTELPAGITAISASNTQSLAVRGADGAVFAWGANSFGQLGDGTLIDKSTPVAVVGSTQRGALTGIVALSAGRTHTLAVRFDGTAFAWGEGAEGRLSTAYPDNVPFPQPVLGISHVIAVAAGDDQSFALVSDPLPILSTATLAFGPQPIASTSSPQEITLTNTGAGPLNIAGITVDGDFAQTNTCPSTLSTGQNCAISVTFSPTQTNPRSGTLTITDDAEGSPRTVTLTGTGVEPSTTYNVTVTQVGDGTVSVANPAGYAAGSQAAFTATAGADRVFLGWTLDGVYIGYASPLTFTVNSNRTLVATFVARPSFGDVPMTDADYQAITTLAALGIVNPSGVNSSGQFQPERPVARAEIAALVARTFGWDAEFHRNTFPDRCDLNGNCIDEELWNTVAALADYGVVGGYTDSATCQSAGTTAPCYLPRDTVSRVQVVSIVARAFTKTPDLRPAGFWERQAAVPGQYINVPDSGTQRSDLATYRANAGTIPGQADDGTFQDPTGAASRRFIIQVLFQAYDQVYGTDNVP